MADPKNQLHLFSNRTWKNKFTGSFCGGSRFNKPISLPRVSYQCCQPVLESSHAALHFVLKRLLVSIKKYRLPNVKKEMSKSKRGYQTRNWTLIGCHLHNAVELVFDQLLTIFRFSLCVSLNVADEMERRYVKLELSVISIYTFDQKVGFLGGDACVRGCLITKINEMVV